MDTRERTRGMDILILIITILIIINLIGDNFINGFKESQAKSYIVEAHSFVEKAKLNKSAEIDALDENNSIKVSVCDLSTDTSPYNNSKYVCDYSYVIITKKLEQITCMIQLLDEKGNSIPLNLSTLINYEMVKSNTNKKDLKSINET